MQQLITANEIRNMIIQSNEYFVKTETELTDFEEMKGDEILIVEDCGLQESRDLLSYTVLEDVLSEEEDLKNISVDLLENVETRNETLYRCCFCDKGHEGWEELANHCMEVHKKMLITKNDFQTIESHCSVCDRDFSSVENCNRHRLCTHCDKFFATSESFLIHSQKKACFDESRSKSINTQKSKLVKQYGCCKCSCMFVSQDACKKHFELDHQNDLCVGSIHGLFSCNYCLAPFTGKSELQKHLKAPRLKMYVCDQCNEQFPSFPKYKQHIETMHDGTQEFGCDECDKVYDRLESLRYHKYMHHNEKNNRMCPDCGKVFKKKVSFVEHRNIHLGLRPHICSICKNGFTSTGALR